MAQAERSQQSKSPNKTARPDAKQKASQPLKDYGAPKKVTYTPFPQDPKTKLVAPTA